MWPSAKEMNAGSSQMSKYLIFRLLGESYGINVLAVREIFHNIVVRILNPAPGRMCGTISLRGKIIPVMDLCCRRHLAGEFEKDGNYVTVVQISPAVGQTVIIGLIMDDVEEMVNISTAEIEKPVDTSGRFPAGSIIGTARIKSGAKALLNLNNLIPLTPSMDFCRAA